MDYSKKEVRAYYEGLQVMFCAFKKVEGTRVTLGEACARFGEWLGKDLQPWRESIDDDPDDKTYPVEDLPDPPESKY